MNDKALNFSVHTNKHISSIPIKTSSENTFQQVSYCELHSSCYALMFSLFTYIFFLLDLHMQVKCGVIKKTSQDTSDRRYQWLSCQSATCCVVETSAETCDGKGLEPTKRITVEI